MRLPVSMVCQISHSLFNDVTIIIALIFKIDTGQTVICHTSLSSCIGVWEREGSRDKTRSTTLRVALTQTNSQHGLLPVLHDIVHGEGGSGDFCYVSAFSVGIHAEPIRFGMT